MEKINLLTLTILFLLATLALPALSQPQCGKQNGNKPCPNNQCCSQYGYCGTTPDYCENNCQSQCSGGGGDIGSIVTPAIFDEMLKHRTTGNCVGQVYTYAGFINAAKSFSGFGTTGDSNARKRELAAFFAQTSHETTGGWPSAPDGQDKWGYCYVRELDQSNAYCAPTYPCAPNQKYFGRGPIQISYNYNYAQFGNKIGRDLINNPDLVATDPTISFQSAIWFWMTPQGNKPSSHNVIIGQWTPSAADRSAGRVPGFGVITNIINGGIECGNGPNDKSNDRIGFYKRYCQMLGVTPGDNLDCNNQKSFNLQRNTNPKTGTECDHEGRMDTVI